MTAGCGRRNFDAYTYLSSVTIAISVADIEYWEWPRDDDRIRCRFCRLNPLGPRQDPLKYLHTEIRYKSTCNCLNYELQVYTTVVAL